MIYIYAIIQTTKCTYKNLRYSVTSSKNELKVIHNIQGREIKLFQFHALTFKICKNMLSKMSYLEYVKTKCLMVLP